MIFLCLRLGDLCFGLCIWGEIEEYAWVYSTLSFKQRKRRSASGQKAQFYKKTALGLRSWFSALKLSFKKDAQL